MKRLYTRVAFDGGMTVPEFGASEPSVHERSASLGDVIQAVSTRWYAVVYRDPITLAACPAAIALNTTVTREVLWLP
jgi:hypothetical protein